MPRTSRRARTRANSAGSLSSMESLALEGLKLKLTFEKLWKEWESDYRDPLKAYVASLPSKAMNIAGHLRLLLVEKFAHDQPNTQRIKDDFLRCLRGNIIRQEELLPMIESGLVCIDTNSNSVIQLLCARLSTQPTDYVVRADTSRPTRTELRWDPADSERIEQLDARRLFEALLNPVQSHTETIIEGSGLTRPQRRR